MQADHACLDLLSFMWNLHKAQSWSKRGSDMRLLLSALLIITRFYYSWLLSGNGWKQFSLEALFKEEEWVVLLLTIKFICMDMISIVSFM